MSAVPASAHPHIFVDVDLALVVDESGALQAIDVTWAYDRFFSLLILEEKGLDADYDDVLSKPELDSLDGWDLQWVPGYVGDVYVTGATGQPLNLGDPVSLGTELRDGRIVTYT